MRALTGAHMPLRTHDTSNGCRLGLQSETVTIRMRSDTRRRLALLAVGVMLAFLMTEASVRLIEPRGVVRDSFETSDLILHHRLVPGAHGRQRHPEFEVPYDINTLGLRDREISREKPPGTKRILFLGDSFTEGWGVTEAERFTSQLRTLVDASGLRTPWQIINAGVSGYSPLLEYLYLKNAGVALEPDLVIECFDMSDLFDDIQFTKQAEFAVNGEPVAVPVAPLLQAGSFPTNLLIPFKTLLREHVETYGFVRRRLNYYRTVTELTDDVLGDLRVDKYGVFREELGPQDDRAWSASYGYLLRMQDLLSSRGIDFWITVHPYGLQVSPREWPGRKFLRFKAGQVYSPRPQELVADFARRHGIPVINMVQDFRDASQTVFPLYYNTDGHWRAAGHRVAAAALHKALMPYLQMHDGTEPETAPSPGQGSNSSGVGNR
jgi:GDSL-like Lipase/Acylhydrolase family